MTSSLRYRPDPSGMKAIVDWLSASQMMRHPVFRSIFRASSYNLILTTDFGHTADGEDVARRGHDQAAFDAGSASAVPGQEFVELGRRVIG
jgi:hypothetical protein